MRRSTTRKALLATELWLGLSLLHGHAEVHKALVLGALRGRVSVASSWLPLVRSQVNNEIDREGVTGRLAKSDRVVPLFE